MVIWSFASGILGAYVIAKGHIPLPLLIQPQSMGALCALCAAQAYYYDRGNSAGRVTMLYLLSLALAGVAEFGLVVAARVSLRYRPREHY